jgi:hypothetical protein
MFVYIHGHWPCQSGRLTTAISVGSWVHCVSEIACLHVEGSDSNVLFTCGRLRQHWFVYMWKAQTALSCLHVEGSDSTVMFTCGRLRQHCLVYMWKAQTVLSFSKAQRVFIVEHYIQSQFFFVGLFKRKCVQDDPHFLMNWNKTSKTIWNVTTATLHKVASDMRTSVDACIAEHCGYLQNLL